MKHLLSKSKTFAVLALSLLTGMGIFSGFSVNSKSPEAVKAATNPVVYFSPTSDSVAGKTITAQFKYGGGSDESPDYSFDPDYTNTYHGRRIYKFTGLEKYGGLDGLYFHDSSWQYKVTAINTWTTTDKFNGKLWNYGSDTAGWSTLSVDTTVTTTVYFAPLSSWVGDNEVKININKEEGGNSESSWQLITMSATGEKYYGRTIYSASITIPGGVYKMEFNAGTNWLTVINNTWTSSSTFSGKLWSNSSSGSWVTKQGDNEITDNIYFAPDQSSWIVDNKVWLNIKYEEDGRWQIYEMTKGSQFYDGRPVYSQSITARGMYTLQFLTGASHDQKGITVFSNTWTEFSTFKGKLWKNSTGGDWISYPSNPSSTKNTYYLYDVDKIEWTPYAYYWQTGYFNVEFPGTVMTDLGNGLWSIEISQSYTNVIFSNGTKGGTNQTDDQTLTGHSNGCFNLWKTTTGSGHANGAWDAVGAPYFIKYDANGATSGSAPSGEDPRVGVSTEAKANTGNLEKTGNNFVGWNTQADGQGTNYAVGSNIVSSTPGQVITLYAKWQAVSKTYTVSFNMQGHGTAIKPQTINEGSCAEKPADPAETGYTFGGWFTNQACTEGNEFDFTTQIYDDTELFAKWTINQYTITFINSDERGGQATADYAYNTIVDVSDFATISEIFDGELDTEPLGRTYVGLKTNPTDEDIFTSITVTDTATYYVCYAFEAASHYTYVNGTNTGSLSDHRDSVEGETYLQVYYLDNVSLTGGQKLTINHDGVDISTNYAVTYDDSASSSLVTREGNIKLDCTGNIVVRFIYDSTNEEYKYNIKVEGTVPTGVFYLSLNGVLSPLTKNGDKYEYYKTEVQIAEGVVVEAYYNQYYPGTLEGDATYFETNSEGKIQCKTGKGGTFDVYLKSNDGGTNYNVFYIAPSGLKDAQDFADAFRKDICAKCELIVAHTSGGIEGLQAIWSSNKTAYDALSLAAKGWIVPSSTDEKISAMFYSYSVAYSKNAANLQKQGGDFLNYFDEDANKLLLSMSTYKHSYKNSEDQTILIVVIASASLLTLSAGALAILLKKKKKENKD